jgi:hypothetical protein
MTDNEDRNINNDEISAILDSMRRIRVFDEELGIVLPFMQMNCFVCKNEQSMIILLDDKGKLCTGDFYCHACNVGNATKESMKMYIERFRKERNSLLKFPDETFGALIDGIKEDQPGIVRMVHELIEAVKAHDPIAIDTINSMRSTKTYKAYPKSLGDENRLFMTLSSYFERFAHRFEGKNGNEKADEFIRLLKQDQA